MVTCPLCNAGIDVDEDELDEGDSLTCEECGANLERHGCFPLELTPEDDEEFDDEDEDYEEEDDDDFDDDDEDEDDDFDEDDEE